MGSIDKYRDNKFVQQSDVDPPILVTIDDVKEEDVSMADKPEKIKYVVYFKEDVKPWAPGYETLQVIYQINGNGNTDYWDGTQLVLYREPNITYGGKLVGGIRCRAPKQQVQAEPVVPPSREDNGPPPPTDEDAFDKAMREPGEDPDPGFQPEH